MTPDTHTLLSWINNASQLKRELWDHEKEKMNK